MTQGNTGSILIKFAIPMMLSGIFQQLYNMMDSIVVGKYDGFNALAAVGASYPITMLFISIAMGGAIGCSVVISQIFGTGDYVKMKTAVSTAVLSIVTIALITTLFGVLFCNSMISLLGTPDDIFQSAAAYLKIYTYGIFFLFLYNITTSIFNGIGDSRTPLYFLIFSSCLNIILDIIFVRNLQMSVEGVAWATVIAQGSASILAFTTLMLRLKKIELKEQFTYFDRSILQNMIRVAIPSILQFSTVAIGQLLVQVLVNSFGAVVIAGYAAAIKIDSFFKVPLQSMGTAVSNFTAQNYGAKKKERILEGYQSAFKAMILYCIVATSIVYLFGDILIGLFDNGSAGDGVVSVGLGYMKIVSPFYIVFILMMLGNGVLRGTSNMKGFVISTAIDLGLRVGLSFLLVGVMGYYAMWWAIPTGWLVGGIIATGICKKSVFVREG